MQVMRSGRPWYGSRDLVVAVWAAITMLGLTIPFLVAQVGSTLSCQLNGACAGFVLLSLAWSHGASPPD
jgi:hypothetical protein